MIVIQPDGVMVFMQRPVLCKNETGRFIGNVYESSIWLALFSKPDPGEYYRIRLKMEAVSRKRARNTMAITLRKVAELAGVSLTTASRVINGKPGVKPEVRERVLEVIRESGYIPNQDARSLAAQRSHKVPSSS
jgi:hypothetical protein